jgi:predicted ester cyclase
VAVRWTATGTHTGEMFGMPATGKRATVTGMDLFRVQEGKLAGFWLSWDQLGMMQQLGVIPGPPA